LFPILRAVVCSKIIESNRNEGRLSKTVPELAKAFCDKKKRGDGRSDMGCGMWEIEVRIWDMGDGIWKIGDRRWEVGYGREQRKARKDTEWVWGGGEGQVFSP